MEWHDRVRRRRKDLGMSQSALAEQIGVSQPLIAKIENGRVKNTEYLEKIISVLGMSASEFPKEAFEKSYADVTAKTITQNDLHWMRINPAEWAADLRLANELPMFATREKPDGAISVQREPIGTLRRPPELGGVIDSYTIYYASSSMAPEFEPGDVLYINPRLTPLPNTTCVFYKDYETKALAVIGRLVSQSNEEWQVLQHSPHQVISLEREVWGRVHRIIARYLR